MFKNRNTGLLRSKHHAIRLAFLFGFASLSSWMPLFNVWLEDAGLKGNDIGYIAAIPWIVMLFVQPVWGYLADSYGKLKYLRLSIALGVFLFAVFPAFDINLGVIVIATVILSVFNTPILPLLDSVALDYVESNPGLSYSKIRFWGAPGYGLGALVTGWLIPLFGTGTAFIMSAVFLIFVFLAIRNINMARGKNKSIDLDFTGFTKVITNKYLAVFLLVIAITAIGQSAITFFMPLYMRQLGASHEIIGIAIGSQALSELPFFFIAAWLLRKTNPGTVVLIAIVGTALRMFLYSINTLPNNVILIEMMNGITWTLLWIASVEFVNETIPVKWRSTGQSLLWASYFGAGSILGNIISGRLYQHMVMREVYLLNGIAIGMLALVSGYFLVMKNNRQGRYRDIKEQIRN